jgi:uncharacterized protein (DUF2236 family)
MEAIDFACPVGAPALFAPDSVTWAVMKNPISLLIGGIAAVILELAEPRVCAGVWEHTRFREDPAGRIRRTGYAALATTFAPAEQARALIGRVSAMHARVAGLTPVGLPYRADDPELLAWVYVTAQFGFVEAYRRYVRDLSAEERDHFYAEAAPVAALWGVRDVWRSAAEAEALFQRMRPKLERSDIVFEFLRIVKRAPLLPFPARPLQGLAVRAAVELTPAWARDVLGLAQRFNLPLGGGSLLRALGAASERIVLDAPPAQACARMGLARDYLYR